MGKKLKGLIERLKRAEQTKEVSAVLSEALFDSNMDTELRRATIKNQVNITSAVVQYAMEYNSSPKQLINAVIEEIKCNKDQVLKDKTVSTQLIEIGISKGVSAGIGK